MVGLSIDSIGGGCQGHEAASQGCVLFTAGLGPEQCSGYWGEGRGFRCKLTPTTLGKNHQVD